MITKHNIPGPRRPTLAATAPHPAAAMASASPPALGCAPLSLSSPALQRSRTVPRCWHQARACSAATPGWHAVPAGLAPQFAQPGLLTSKALCMAALRGCPNRLVTPCCVVNACLICKHCPPIPLQFCLEYHLGVLMPLKLRCACCPIQLRHRGSAETLCRLTGPRAPMPLPRRWKSTEQARLQLLRTNRARVV